MTSAGTKCLSGSCGRHCRAPAVRPGCGCSQQSMSIHPQSIHPTVHLSIPSIHQPSVHPRIRRVIYPSLHLSVCPLSICLSSVHLPSISRLCPVYLLSIFCLFVSPFWYIVYLICVSCLSCPSYLSYLSFQSYLSHLSYPSCRSYLSIYPILSSLSIFCLNFIHPI